MKKGVLNLEYTYDESAPDFFQSFGTSSEKLTALLTLVVLQTNNAAEGVLWLLENKMVNGGMIMAILADALISWGRRAPGVYNAALAAKENEEWRKDLEEAAKGNLKGKVTTEALSAVLKGIQAAHEAIVDAKRKAAEAEKEAKEKAEKKEDPNEPEESAESGTPSEDGTNPEK
jgi:hypothetical protein